MRFSAFMIYRFVRIAHVSGTEFALENAPRSVSRKNSRDRLGGRQAIRLMPQCARAGNREPPLVVTYLSLVISECMQCMGKRLGDDLPKTTVTTFSMIINRLNWAAHRFHNQHYNADHNSPF